MYTRRTSKNCFTNSKGLVDIQRGKGHSSGIGRLHPREARGCPENPHIVSQHTRNPFREGIHANVPMEISVFLDRAVFTVLFACGVPPTRKFSYVPFTRGGLGVRRVSPSHFRSLVSRILHLFLSFSLSVSLSIYLSI